MVILLSEVVQFLNNCIFMIFHGRYEFLFSKFHSWIILYNRGNQTVTYMILFSVSILFPQKYNPEMKEQYTYMIYLKQRKIYRVREV